MMRVIVKYFFVLLIYFCFLDSVSAMVCDSSKIAELRNYASNIEVTYEYFDDKVIGDQYVSSYYDVYLFDINEDFSLRINNVYHNPVNGEFKFVYNYEPIKIDIYSYTCDTFVKTIKVELPRKNPYYDSDICYELRDKNLYVCEEWSDTPISEEEFNEVVSKYETVINMDEDEEINYFLVYITNNPIKVSLLLLSIIGIVVFLIFRRRKKGMLC